MKSLQRSLTTLAIVLSVVAGSAAENKNKKAEVATREAKSYNLAKLNLIDPYIQIARTADLPTISVLMPKDLMSFRDSLPPAFVNSGLVYRTLVFPQGFGLEPSRSGYGSYIAQGGGVRSTPGSALERQMAGVNTEYEVRNSQAIVSNNQLQNQGYSYLSPTLATLQNELTTAMTQSRKFNVLIAGTGPSSQDLMTLETEKKIGQKRTDRPLDKMQTADFVLCSSIGLKSMEVKRSSFTGDNEITDLIESILAGNTSPTKTQRVSQVLNVFRSYTRYRDETVVSVVVNLYIASERKIIAAGYGVGLAKVQQGQGTTVGGVTREKLASEDFLLDGVRMAVQDALNNVSAVN